MFAGEENAGRPTSALATTSSGGHLTPLSMPDINHFAMTNWRNRRELVGIRRADRRLHTYVIGRTGMGKTSLLANMATNDIRGGEGACFIDPHGDAVELRSSSSGRR